MDIIWCDAYNLNFNELFKAERGVIVHMFILSLDLNFLNFFKFKFNFEKKGSYYNFNPYFLEKKHMK
jgi:hypothetical protein